MPTTARKTRWYSTGGPWGTGLLLLGVATTLQGVAYTFGNPAELSPALQWAGLGVPIRALGLMWLTAGAYSIFRALTPPQRHTDVIPVVTVICLWSIIYLLHWVYSGVFLADWTREWTAGLAWGSLGALIVSWSRCVNPPTGR